MIVTANREDDSISLIDANTLQHIADVKVGSHPFGVTIDAAGKFAYTANVQSNDITVVDLATRTIAATVKVGQRPYAIALAKGLAFVTNQGSSTVSVVDLGTRVVIKTIRVGTYPEGIAADAAGWFVYVACWSENTLERIDVGTLGVTGKTTVGDGPRAFGSFLR